MTIGFIILIDILFSSVPLTETNQPIMAPALLKSIATSAGFSSCAIDLNAEILNLIKDDDNRTEILDFLIHNNLHPTNILNHKLN